MKKEYTKEELEMLNRWDKMSNVPGEIVDKDTFLIQQDEQPEHIVERDAEGNILKIVTIDRI